MVVLDRPQPLFEQWLAIARATFHGLHASDSRQGH